MARIAVPAGDGGDAVQVWTLRPEMGRAVNRLVDAAYNKSILPVRVREGARMRIAQLNDCPVCLASGPRRSRTRASPRTSTATSPTTTRPTATAPRSSSPSSTPSASPWTTSSIDDAFFARLAECFTDAEILDLTICLAAFLGLGRMLRSLGIDETSLLDV